MPTYTANYNLTIPTVNADANVWGTLTNANWPIIDTKLKDLDTNKLSYNPTTFEVTSRVNFVHSNIRYLGEIIATQNWVTDQIIATGSVPPGGIIMWSGTLATIPTGWALCNGANGTPDLRSRFVMGAANGANPGTSGGATTHDHGGATAAHALSRAQMPEHSHGVTQTAHSHPITDKSHDHNVDPHSHTITIEDPGHTHAYNSSLGTAKTNDGSGSDVPAEPTSGTTGSKTTGISASASNTTVNIDQAFTGITTTNGATANITINDTGGGGAHSHDITAANHLPPYYALAFIMKL